MSDHDPLLRCAPGGPSPFGGELAARPAHPALRHALLLFTLAASSAACGTHSVAGHNSRDSGSNDGSGGQDAARGDAARGDAADAGDSCSPNVSCAGLGKNCGFISDGCGGTLSCGSCTSPETCGGGGVAHVCGQPGSSGAMAPPSGYSASQLIFEDRFTSTSLDTSKWNPSIGDDQHGRWAAAVPGPYSAPNPYKNMLQYYDPYPAAYGTKTTSAHLVTGPSGLQMIAAPSSYFASAGYSWASGCVASYGKMWLPATGGYVQIRAKMPDMRYGGWGALWMLPGNAGSGGAEFDIIDGAVNVATTGNPLANSQMFSKWFGTGKGSTYDTGVDLTAAYHVYGLEYRPGQSFKTYFDGTLVHTWSTGVSASANYEIIMSLQIASSKTAGWHTQVDPNHSGPFTMSVNDIQIYSLP